MGTNKKLVLEGSTYFNVVYKWPESDAEFMKSLISGGCDSIGKGGGDYCGVGGCGRDRKSAADNYTFSREEDYTYDWLGYPKYKRKRRSDGGCRSNKSFNSVLRQMLSCGSVKINDVVD
ncbi:hypothetical protein MIMGU_mgv1a016515mg [Erythranthe guttata]|uniref:Uncharacterized protein n=1 Tax=Erythranthe guttata TaxID=4155 RepID=A0A022RN41_ERYGU|nr:hypothetical protein MIMGU_mgv1a016515mg [Erythranthe guttata]